MKGKPCHLRTRAQSDDLSPIMERAEKLVNLILRHAPRLEELYLRNPTPLNKKVVSMFQKRTGQKYNP